MYRTMAYPMSVAATALLVAVCGAATSQAETLLKLDARQQPSAPETGYFKMGSSVSPDGHTLGINNQYLTKDGKPWLPVMGEFHFTRYPVDEWEAEIVKMKSAGIDVIATYLFWIHHEEKAGEFNWTGDRDIARFIDLCAKHQMKVFLRIGPWAHGEARYGGTPEWVVEQMPTRRNDPTYMSYVTRYWKQLGAQVKGKFWKDGGPVIGVQLDNEYNLTGPGMGAEHIQSLKNLALSIGFDVPLYTVTGWDGALYPKGEVTPVFAGYPDEPWALITTKMAPNEVYRFRFNSRVAGDAGAETKAHAPGTSEEDIPHTPFLGAEYGGGLSITYRRRPLLVPDDIGAMWPAQLGSGVNLYGYYMFHGGRNPKGHGRLEENGLLGAYKDLPIINYDYQAAYGQYGQVRPVLNVMRPYHIFANSFGDRLVPMAVHASNRQPVGRDDFTTPRLSVRSAGERGFVFMNNYIRQYPMAAQEDIQFDIDLPGGKMKFPSRPITVPSGAYFIWPFNFDLDGANLKWATAQPLTRVDAGANESTYFFTAEDGIPAEFAFSNSADVQLSGASISKSGDLSIVRLTPSTSVGVKLRIGARTVSIVLLSSKDGARVWAGDVAGQRRIVLTDDTVGFGLDGLDLRSTGDAVFKLGVHPALRAAPKGNLAIAAAKDDGVFQTFSATAPAKTIQATVTQTREAGEAPPVRIGGSVNTAVQPFPEAFGRTGAWSIALPENALDGLADAFMQISYRGDIARLFSGAEMLDDEFFYGPAWTIGLKRFERHIKSPLTLTIMPLRRDAPIYIDDAVKAALPPGDQVAGVASVKVVPQYQLKLRFQ